MLTILLLALTTAGITIAWQTFLDDHPEIKHKLKARSTFFVCGVCQIFWLTLLFALSINASFVIPVSIEVSLSVQKVVSQLVFWQSIAVIAYFLRYGFFVLLESLKVLLRKNNI